LLPPQPPLQLLGLDPLLLFLFLLLLLLRT
jgi:hypothetical protein